MKPWQVAVLISGFMVLFSLADAYDAYYVQELQHHNTP